MPNADLLTQIQGVRAHNATKKWILITDGRMEKFAEAVLSADRVPIL